MNHRDTNYFKIGSFVLLGLAIIITSLIVLGWGKLFKKTIYAETYFNESVQGLTEGSPVKYRGLQIGYVKEIQFINDIYPESFSKTSDIYSRYIYVLVAITLPSITLAKTNDLEDVIQKDVRAGLRFKLTLQGVTGNAFLDLNFVEPDKNTPLPINWAPKHLYIPSTMSMLSRASDNISYVLDELKQVDLNGLFNHVDSLTIHTNHVMQQVDALLQRNTPQLNELVNNLTILSEQAKNYPSSIFLSTPPPKLDPGRL